MTLEDKKFDCIEDAIKDFIANGGRLDVAKLEVRGVGSNKYLPYRGNKLRWRTVCEKYWEMLDGAEDAEMLG